MPDHTPPPEPTSPPQPPAAPASDQPSSETLAQRLAVKNQTIATLEAFKAEASPKLAQFDQVAAERDAANRTLERLLALPQALRTQEHVDGLGAIYDRYAAQRGDQAASFGDWLNSDAKNNPVTRHLFGSPPAPSASTSAQPNTEPTQPPATQPSPPQSPAPAPPAVPPTTATVDAHADAPAPTSGRMTPAQLEAFLRGKTPEEVDAWLAQNAQAYGIPYTPKPVTASLFG